MNSATQDQTGMDRAGAERAATVLPPVVVRRVFHAKPALVFKAFTNPDLLMKWWGHDGFKTPVAEIDLAVGGIR